MDAEQFRKAGKEMVDLMADYMENIRDRRPLSNVEPGYLSKLIPGQAPEEGEKWEDVVSDVERVVMPGVTHWHHPQFHAYYPTGNSYPAILGDMLSDIIGCVGFTWSSSPACTELEIVMMDWLGKMLQLPEDFLSGGKGGGIIQGTASESALVALYAARNKVIAEAKAADPAAGSIDQGKLVVYGSDQAHSCIERAAMFGGVQYHVVESDAKASMRGEALTKAIAGDRNKGLIPFYVVATLGTTSSCAFDNMQEIGPVCQRENVWLHIDAAYAGSAFICPEFRPLLDGVEHADSFNFNPHKWLLVNFDCSAMWFKNASHIVDAYYVDPVFLRHNHQGQIPDFRHWQIPLGRRFRSLKLWFVLRLYGVKGLQEHIRQHVALAQRFESLVKSDPRFEVTHEVKLGLVCFKLKGSNDLNKKLLQNITKDGRIHLVAGESKEVYFLRLALCSTRTNNLDMDLAWAVVKELASQTLAAE